MQKDKLILPCIRGVLGNWVYYVSTMTGSQISSWIRTDKKYRESEYLDDILQRDLKDRKQNIAKYLLGNDSRFFNSIVVGVFGGLPDWHQFNIEKKLDELGVNCSDYAQTESVGLIEFQGNEEMFAIDGQHRVAGIQIANEEDKKSALEDRCLYDDTFSVIFIAHVDDDEGKKRTRRLFSDINKNAKPVAKGDKIKIDEEDLCAIVSRRIYSEYSHFQKGKLISLDERASMPAADYTHFTNISCIYDITKRIKMNFRKEKGTEEWDELNVDVLKKMVIKFLDFSINNMSDLKLFFLEKSLTLKQARNNNRYILFRPVGLILLAELYALFVKTGKVEWFKANIDRVEFKFPESPLNKTIWNAGKIELKKKRIAKDILIYILGHFEGNLDVLLREYKDITKNEDATLPETLAN